MHCYCTQDVLRVHLRATDKQIIAILDLGIERCADFELLREGDVLACGVPVIHMRRGLPRLLEISGCQYSSSLVTRGGMNTSSVNMHNYADPPLVDAVLWTHIRDALLLQGERGWVGGYVSDYQASSYIAMCTHYLRRLMPPLSYTWSSNESSEKLWMNSHACFDGKESLK